MEVKGEDYLQKVRIIYSDILQDEWYNKIIKKKTIKTLILTILCKSKRQQNGREIILDFRWDEKSFLTELKKSTQGFSTLLSNL